MCMYFKACMLQLHTMLAMIHTYLGHLFTKPTSSYGYMNRYNKPSRRLRFVRGIPIQLNGIYLFSKCHFDAMQPKNFPVTEKRSWASGVLSINLRRSRYCTLTMMTSSNGNTFRVTDHLCGEFTDTRWILRTKACDAELWCFLWSASE